jgi:hypothetical protein
MFRDLLQILAFLPNKIEKLCYEYTVYSIDWILSAGYTMRVKCSP